MKKKSLWTLVVLVLTVTAGSSLLLRSSAPKISLDEYLSSCGFHLSPAHSNVNEGYLSAPQARQFQEQLKVHPHIKSIAEIGLNAGNSASTFLRNCKGVKKFTSFDINQHVYTSKAVEYFKKYYANCFEFVSGDSAKTVVEYAKDFPGQKFDLIYVDGAHTFEGCLADLVNCKELAHPETTVWVEGFNIPTVHSAIYTLIGQKFLELESAHVSNSEHGERQWVKLRYRF